MFLITTFVHLKQYHFVSWFDKFKNLIMFFRWYVAEDKMAKQQGKFSKYSV